MRTLYYRVFSKEVSSTIFKVFDMTWPGIEPRSPEPLVNSDTHHYKVRIRGKVEQFKESSPLPYTSVWQ